MGLFSIALPDRKVIFPVWDGSCSEKDRTVLFKSKWMSVGTSRNTVGHGRFDNVDLKHVFSNVTGTAFMKSMVAFLGNDASMTMGDPNSEHVVRGAMAKEIRVGGRRIGDQQQAGRHHSDFRWSIHLRHKPGGGKENGMGCMTGELQ